MLKVIATIGVVGDEDDWQESITVNDKSTAYKEVRAIIKNYFWSDGRKIELRGNLKIPKDQIGLSHDWKRGLTNIWECKNCKKRTKSRMGSPSIMGCKGGGVKKRFDKELR